MKYLSTILLLFYVGCATSNVSFEGRLARIGIAIDASVNSIADITQTLYVTKKISNDERTNIINVLGDVTEKQMDLIPTLRSLDAVPNADSKTKAIQTLQQILVMLNGIHNVENPDATAELIQKVGQIYVLATDLVGEIR